MSESEAIVELLSAPKTFAAIIPDAPADVLQSAFLAQNGTVCLIALDDLRRSELSTLAEQLHQYDLELPEFIVRSPVELEIQSASKPASLKDLQIIRYIVYVCQTDLRDLTIRYWLNIHRMTGKPAPVAYFCREPATLKAFSTLADIEIIPTAPSTETRTFFYFPDTGDTPELPQSLRAHLQKVHPVLHARLEADRARVNEALHRSHALHKDRRPLPIHINPIEYTRGTILTTTSYALIAGLTARERDSFPDDSICLTAYHLFSAFKSHALDTLQSTPYAQALLAWFQRSGIIAQRGRMLELTPTGEHLFPGIEHFASLGILHSYTHDTSCKTVSGDPVGRIETQFLRTHQDFLLANTLIHRHFHNLLASEATLKARSDQPGELCLDTLPFTCSRTHADDMRRLLTGALTPDATLSPEAADRLADLQSEFASLPQFPCIELNNTAAHWWTFAGTELNLILADLVRKIAPKLRISTGSLHLRIDWPISPMNTGTSLKDKFVFIATKVHCAAQQCSPELAQYLMRPYWRRHPYAWLLPLLPEQHKTEIFQNDFRAFQNHFGTAPSPVIFSEKLHELDALPFKFAPLPPSSLAPHTPPQIHTKINSKTATTPIHPGIMHTQLPWDYIDSPELLAMAINHMLSKPYIALDVETTLTDQSLCLIQIGCDDQTYIIDPCAVNFTPLEQVFANPRIIKIIHNASFETRILKKYNIQILNITDTITVSRRIRGNKCPGGHSLKAVCMREFGLDMDKTNQTSRWEKRPLSPSQLEYAALDAEILIKLYKHFFKL